MSNRSLCEVAVIDRIPFRPTRPHQVVTVATGATLPGAMALAKSLAETNPELEVTIVRVDLLHQEEPAGGESHQLLHIVGIDALPIDEVLLFELATVLAIEELGVVLRPWALAFLLAGDAQAALYLSPDSYVCDQLDDLFALADQYGAVVTPRFNSLPVRDGLLSAEEQILADGFFEEGLLGTGRQRLAALESWQTRIMVDFGNAIAELPLGGRRWFDVIAHLLDAHVLRDDGYSMAHWNLHERKVTRIGDGYSANGAPVRTLRFKGYCPSTPWLLSTETSANPRVLLSESPELRELCDRYRATLSRQRAEDPAPTYLFDRLSDGTVLTPRLRYLFHRELVRARAAREEAPPPPGMGDDAAFVAWWREPAFPETLVNRFLYALWSERPDLQATFANPVGGDEVDFLRWAWTTPYDADLGEAQGLLPAKTSLLAPIIKRAPGVNLVGYFSVGVGVGEVARLLVDGIQRAGIPHALYNSQKTVGRLQAEFVWEASDDRYAVTIATVTAEQLPVVAREIGRSLLADCDLVGIWAWEVADFPDYPEALALVDEIWALSEFSRRAITARTSKPVSVIPVPIGDPGLHQPLDRVGLSLPEGPYLLFVFDYLSIFERKNPLGLVRAFTRAFDEGEGPLLVIKSINGDHCRADREHLRALCGGRSDIYLIEEYLPEEVMSSLMGEATAYVSLHRAEGFGLTLAEAMVRGLPVIATGYSGNLEFMNPTNSLLIDYQLVPIGPGISAYPASSVWADPDLDAAAAAMRWVIQHPDEARELGHKGRLSVLGQLTFDRLTAFLWERLGTKLQEQP